ncbi:tryptophan 2,3-dioxygenase family protein [Micromonospora sp. SH-82]|uniref:tryptophan 2,3-dioxygenase family protein n=1 Tax=Micromonospora sp. SH-82 TaxID=3132938 RepID=UPI003EBAAC3F
MTRPQALPRWLAQHRPTAGTFPYDEVVDAYQRHGKHHVPAEWITLLRATRERLPQLGDARQLPAFLNSVLDKADGRYDYRTYLALDLLPMPDPDDESATAGRMLARRDRLHALLLTDLIRFEMFAADTAAAPLPHLRPGRDLVVKRLRHTVRAAMPALRRLRILDDPAAGDPVAAARHTVAAADLDLTAADRLTLRATMLPVSTVHDEWMFIRVLQTFEVTFALLAFDLNAVIAAITAGRMSAAGRRLSCAADLLAESGALWPLAATLQPEAFHAFRPYTEGASAIQSRHYKLVESLCRMPDTERVDSPAYRSVPDVLALIHDGQPTIDRTLADRNDIAGSTGMKNGLADFSAALQQWRRTHYRLAVRMLGPERTGTGHTLGTPYLAQCRTTPVFTYAFDRR